MHVIGHHRNPVIRHFRERNTGSVARARCRPVAATCAGYAVQLRGWSPTLKAFVHYEGGDVVDAAVLLVPLVR